jgi:hypothetical protein
VAISSHLGYLKKIGKKRIIFTSNHSKSNICTNSGSFLNLWDNFKMFEIMLHDFYVLKGTSSFDFGKSYGTDFNYG